MSKAHIAADKMDVGARGTGRHWTKAEVEARRAAAEELKRRTAVKLRCPAWLSAAARRVWNRVKRQAAEFDMLDELDADMLAIYCDLVAQYQAANAPRPEPETVEEKIESARDAKDSVQQQTALARLIAQYADRLGLTPAARVRLAQRRAVKEEDRFGDEFDG